MRADHKQVAQILKTARGQIDGILKMVDDDRYCIDISNQLLATEALLKKTNRIVLAAHMKNCVKEAFDTTGDVDQKIEEILRLIDKLVN
jgi:DNA-binding FrmR family transcriptional regulator